LPPPVVGETSAINRLSTASTLASSSLLAPAQVAAVVGGLLMNEQMEVEKLRRRPVTDDHTETNRWRDLARKEALRRM
ncbi:MAG TPA: hypothetical protein VFN02_15965, partial [Ktedonobacteraceae bacterium]|nr:hypothetical protein [Ktedonobacteraceae bacterium]